MDISELGESFMEMVFAQFTCVYVEHTWKTTTHVQ